MRSLRLLGEGRCFYHCVSRVVDGKFVFEKEGKDFFRETMRGLAQFTGIDIITYCIMDDHIHLLLGVPDADSLPPFDESSLLACLSETHDPIAVKGVKKELEQALQSKNEKLHQEILHRYEYRRGSISEFMKTLKQRFTQWYNRTHGRKGTVWEARYKSVLVEDKESALLTMAAYIDLNPVRAEIVDSPEQYPWCGYGEAVAGKIEARDGLASVLSEALRDGKSRADWRRTHNRYRQLLFADGEEMNNEGNKLSVQEVLRHRVRYFSDGSVFGTERFVNNVFEADRSRYGAKRKTGARQMQGADWGGLRVMRDLQKNVID